MSTTSIAIFSNPLFSTYSVYARNASIVMFTSVVLIYYMSFYSDILFFCKLFSQD